MSAPAPDPLVPRSLRVTAAWSWRLIVIALAVGLTLYALAQVRVVVLPVFAALLLCTFLAPLVLWLDRRGIPRAVAVLLVLVGAVVVIGGIVTAIAVQIRQSLDELEAGARQGVREVEEWLVEGPLGIERKRIGEGVEQAIDWFTSADGALQAGLLSRAATALEIVGGIGLAVVLVFFFLKDGDHMWAYMTRRLGTGAGPHVHQGGMQAWQALGGYMRGQAIIAAVDAVFIGLGIFLLGVPFAVPLAVITFFAAFFPIVGAVVAGLLAILIALATNGFITALLVAAVVLGVQQTESNVLEPVIMARTARLHPVVVLVALGAGAALGGLIGAFLAVPLAAAAAAVARYAWPRVGPDTETDAGGPQPKPEPEAG